MNKQSIITILFTVLMSMIGTNVLAFSVANSDGVTIYYTWANEEKQNWLSVMNTIIPCMVMKLITLKVS